MNTRSTSTLTRSKSIDTLPLEEVIRRLRGGLLESAINRPAGFKPMFEITEATVELAISFQRTSKIGSKLSIYVAEVGAEGAEASTASHRILLKLIPLKKGVTITEEDAKDPTYQGSGKHRRRR